MRLIEERRGSAVISYVYEPDSYVPLARLDADGERTEQGGLGTTHDAQQPGTSKTIAASASQSSAGGQKHPNYSQQPANDTLEASYWQALNSKGTAQGTGTDGPSANANLCEVYYFHTDQVGLPEELSNAQGQIIWQAQYKTWGSTVEERWEARRLHGAKVQGQTEGNIPQGDRQEQNLRFQGQYLDRETGLHYNTFRYYDADIGRFISPDPIGLGGGINLGSYSPNPLSWIDPWGLTCRATTQKLNAHAKSARAEVYKDPQRMLSSNQRAAIKRAYDRGDLGQARSRYRRYVGNQIDKRFKQKVESDPSLAGKVKTTPNGKRGPDVYGVGDKKGQWWDLTTQKDWDRGRHQTKYEPTHGADYEGIIW